MGLIFLFKEFQSAFSDADVLIVTDIYAASEAEIDGVHAFALCEAIRKQGHPDVHYIPGFDDIAEYIASIAGPDDVVITQGAGSVWKAGEALLKRLEWKDIPIAKN